MNSRRPETRQYRKLKTLEPLERLLHIASSVIPAKARIHLIQRLLGPVFHRGG
jgi:hypothetical protein